MTGLLSGKAVLASCGTQGVGAAVARAAAREGAAVAVTGRRPEPGEPVATDLRALGAEARFVRCDVADLAAVRACVAEVVDVFGRDDGLVNAAGLVDRGTLLDTTPELFDRHVAPNGATEGWRERAGKELPMGRLGDPDEIAGMVVVLLSDSSGVVTGSVIDWDQTVLGGTD